jgi:hypothetical protein
MAKRYIGNAVVTIAYHDDGDYRGTVSAGGYTWRFSELHPPRIGFKFAYDSPEAYDEMAASAVSFGSYYDSERPDDPSEEVASAIGDAAAWAQDDRGEYEVLRKPRRATAEAREDRRAASREARRREVRGGVQEKHVVADFNTLEDLVEHARKEGATHVVRSEEGDYLIFPAPSDKYRPYRQASIWKEGGYWHSEAPAERLVIASIPSEARPIANRAHRGAAPRIGGRRVETKTRRDPTTGRQFVPASEVEHPLPHDTVVRIVGFPDDLTGTIVSVDSSSSEYEVRMPDGFYWYPFHLVAPSALHHDALNESRTVKDYIAVDSRDRRVAGPFKTHHEAAGHVPEGGYVKFASGGPRRPPPAPSSYPMFREGRTREAPYNDQYMARYVHKISPRDTDVEGPFTIPGNAFSDRKTLGAALRKAKVISSGASVRSFRVEGEKIVVFPTMPGLTTYWHSIILTPA